MEDFLKNMLDGIEKNMKSCANANTANTEELKKPFDQVYDKVRENQDGILSFEEYKAKKKKVLKNLKNIYVNGEQSVYTEVIREFLKQHPELGKDFKEK